MCVIIYFFVLQNLKMARSKKPKIMHPIIDPMAFSIQFPLDNLSVINNGSCRICNYARIIENGSDIRLLQIHYQNTHQVIDVPQIVKSNKIVQHRELYQEVDSESVVGKMHIFLPLQSHYSFIKDFS